jgi:hypothetical protein
MIARSLRTRATLGALTLALSVGAFATDARAFCRSSTVRGAPGECSSSGIPLMWCSACAGLSLHVDGSIDIPIETLRTEATGAAARWSASVACPGETMEPPAFELRVIDDTRVLSGINHGGPNANTVSFNSEWRLDSLHRMGTIAITIVSFDRRTGEILDADVELNQRTDINPAGFVFSTGMPMPDTADLSTILTHEFGHGLGLGHSDQDRAVMWPTAGMGESRRTLSADDVEGICDVYAFDRRPSMQCDPVGTTARPALLCNDTPYGGLAPAVDGGRVVGGCAVVGGLGRSSATRWWLLGAALVTFGWRRRATRRLQ